MAGSLIGPFNLEFVNRASKTLSITVPAAVSSAKMVICQKAAADNPLPIFTWSSVGGADGAIVISGAGLILTPTFVLADTKAAWHNQDVYVEVVWTATSKTQRILQGKVIVR